MLNLGLRSNIYKMGIKSVTQPVFVSVSVSVDMCGREEKRKDIFPSPTTVTSFPLEYRR